MGLLDDALRREEEAAQRAGLNRTWRGRYDWRFHLQTHRIPPTAVGWTRDPAGDYATDSWTRLRLREVAELPSNARAVLGDFIRSRGSQAYAEDGWVIPTPQGHRLFMCMTGADPSVQSPGGFFEARGRREAENSRRAAIAEVQRNLKADGARARRHWLTLGFGHPYLRNIDQAHFNFELVEVEGQGPLFSMWDGGPIGTSLAEALAVAATDRLRTV